MATYKKIQEWVRETHGFTPKTCHIADVKAEFNPSQRKAVNRINGEIRQYPCPPHEKPAIVAALEHFGDVERSN
jgi:hypothetical protein